MKTPNKVAKAALFATALAMSASTIVATAAQAQGYNSPPPPQGYNNAPPAGQDYDNSTDPDRDYTPPPAYQGDVPPPPGYSDQDRSAEQSAQARAEDQRYEEYSERWAAENCVDQRNNNTVAGAIIGGLFGAAIGAGVAGRHDAGAGALVGGALGAGVGASVGASSATGPGCPPGYVVRQGAPAFYSYAGPIYGGGVVYAAPTWYRPWVWYGGRWVYRPYPYHRYYYRHYWANRPGEWQRRQEWREHHNGWR